MCKYLITTFNCIIVILLKYIFLSMDPPGLQQSLNGSRDRNYLLRDVPSDFKPKFNIST